LSAFRVVVTKLLIAFQKWKNHIPDDADFAFFYPTPPDCGDSWEDSVYSPTLISTFVNAMEKQSGRRHFADIMTDVRRDASKYSPFLVNSLNKELFFKSKS